jgi:acyl carrier protein
MKEKLIKSLAEALEMESGQIQLQDTFRDYQNYSSLTELSILAMLDSDFGIELEMKDYNLLKTVDDMLKLIDSRSSQ